MSTPDTSTNHWHALGNARLQVAAEAKTAEEWQERWPAIPHELPFEWGSCWTATITYKVADYAAEIGFFVDGLGFQTNAFDPSFCMFATPDRSYFFAIVPAGEEAPTPPDSIRVSFMVADIERSARELAERGIEFTRGPEPYMGSRMLSGELRTPNGVPVELWGMGPEAE